MLECTDKTLKLLVRGQESVVLADRVEPAYGLEEPKMSPGSPQLQHLQDQDFQAWLAYSARGWCGNLAPHMLWKPHSTHTRARVRARILHRRSSWSTVFRCKIQPLAAGPIWPPSNLKSIYTPALQLRASQQFEVRRRRVNSMQSSERSVLVQKWNKSIVVPIIRCHRLNFWFPNLVALCIRNFLVNFLYLVRPLLLYVHVLLLLYYCNKTSSCYLFLVLYCVVLFPFLMYPGFLGGLKF